MSGALLEVQDLSTWIDTDAVRIHAVDGLTFDVQRGETFALLGESGCGKSVTALSIMRLLPEAGRVVAGQVTMGGTDLLQISEAEMRAIRGARIGMIFQEPMLSLNPVLTVGAQITEVLERHTRARKDEAEARARELLESVGVPDAERRLQEYPFQLSGGLRQRVMIAIALACEPQLLIADEPTTALDVTIQAQVLDLLRSVQRTRAMSMLLITHDLGVVAETAHRVGVMYAGQLAEVAGVEAFFDRPLHPYARKLFASLPARAKRGQALSVIGGGVPSLEQQFQGCRFAERCDFVRPQCRTAAPPLAEHTSGRSVRCHWYSGLLGTDGLPPIEVKARAATAARIELSAQRDSAQAVQPPPLLAVNDLRVHFPIHRGVFRRVAGYVRAVDGVSLSIPAGRTLALVGESGCGKTTVGKGVLRLLAATGGEVLFDGEDLVGLSGAELRARRRHFQIVFQDPYSSLNPRMRVNEILEEGMTALEVGVSGAERSARIDALLHEVGLDPAAKSRYPHEFSGGQRQRIAIARALAVEPRLIVCDEPTSALDVSVQAQILNLLLDLQRRHGIAYLFITHNMGVVEFLAHEVAVMYLGRIVERGSVEEIFTEPKHPYTRALLSAVPVPDPQARREAIRVSGDLPSPVAPPPGCHFHARCPRAHEPCATIYPAEFALPGSQRVRCHLYDESRPNARGRGVTSAT
jgi:peptide/nickel transport system ATP-binding protein